MFGSRYPGLEFLAAPVVYCELLADEVEQFADLSIAEILSLAPPSQYLARWAADLRLAFNAALAAA